MYLRNRSRNCGDNGHQYGSNREDGEDEFHVSDRSIESKRSGGYVYVRKTEVTMATLSLRSRQESRSCVEKNVSSLGSGVLI